MIETIEIIFISIALITLPICIIFYIKNSIEIKKIQGLIIRNEEVYAYRKVVLERSLQEFDNLPSYETMVESEKPFRR